MSAPEDVTEEELLAMTMYGAALQIDADRASEEFFRMHGNEQDFWVRAAYRALKYFENRLGPQPTYLALETHEELMGRQRDAMQREIEELERAIINLVLAIPARAAKPEMAAIPLKGKVT